jgi:uncharacterized protein (DUF427 family)
MARAIFNGVVIAESDNTKMVEGNHYFPPESVKMEYFTPTDRRSTCPWKGDASYYTVAVNGEQVENVAWTYKSPRPAADQIANHIAFYSKVRVEN